MYHSDRGVQYASYAYKQTLKDNWFLPSISRKGNCWDNAPMESFFHTLKQELVYSLHKPSRITMKQEVFRYIEGFYNKERLHSSIDYMAPKRYLEKIQQQLKIN